MHDKIPGADRSWLGSNPGDEASNALGPLGARLAERVKKVLNPYLRPRTFRKGHLLWSEGDRDGMLVFLCSGKVKIYRLLPTGKAITLYIFESGAVFGFMPFLDGAPYPAYAQALENCEARVMHRSSLLEAIGKDPRVALFLIEQLSERLRQAMDRIEVLSSRGTAHKVAAALSALLPEASSPDSLTTITLPLASAELAAEIGITPETFSRSISELVKRKVIKRLKTNTFQVLDVSKLRELSGEAIW